VTSCRRCHRDIQWAVTSNGKPMPLDPARREPDDEAANVAVYRDHTGRLNARVLKQGEQPERHEWRAMPHFATCAPEKAARDARAGRLRDEGVIPFPSRTARKT
jgi:hypothetical protein